MPRKRRKLSKEMESDIALSKKAVELINAQINDIDEEDILEDYSTAFKPVITVLVELVNYYDLYGFTEESSELISKFNDLLSSFQEEYEL